MENKASYKKIGYGLRYVTRRRQKQQGRQNRLHPALTEFIQACVYTAHGERLTTGRTLVELDQLTVQTPSNYNTRNFRSCLSIRLIC
ncbi:unnamed protein product [Meloidogyne enterolobii]|uniref:Uncharacterized protein n=1 Tax=Meloidogyne enterolobii TaxID=390850 RepID=A0ACB0ZAH1_MELEN